MPKQSITLQQLGINRNVLLAVVASVGSIGTSVLLDGYAVSHNGATPGVITSIACICSDLIVFITALVHMAIYYRIASGREDYDPVWYALPTLAVAFVWTITTAFLVSFYK